MKSSYTLENLTAAVIAALLIMAKDGRPAVERIALEKAAEFVEVCAGYDEGHGETRDYIVRVACNYRPARFIMEHYWGRLNSTLESVMNEGRVFVEFADCLD